MERKYCNLSEKLMETWRGFSFEIWDWERWDDVGGKFYSFRVLLKHCQ